MESFRASRFSANFILQHFAVTVRGYLASPSLSSRVSARTTTGSLSWGLVQMDPCRGFSPGPGAEVTKVRHRRRAVPKSDQHGNLLFGPVAAIAAAQRRTLQIPQTWRDRRLHPPQLGSFSGREAWEDGWMARIGWRAWKWKCPPSYRRGALRPGFAWDAPTPHHFSFEGSMAGFHSSMEQHPHPH